MPQKNTINTVFFDFGGCIDGTGVHSRTLFSRALRNVGLDCKDAEFHDAYSYADRLLIEQGLVLGLGLSRMNEIMLEGLLEHLDPRASIDSSMEEVAAAITAEQSRHIQNNKSVLQQLYKKGYRLGMISNFSGNLEVVLEEFGLRKYFSAVCDSYHVGFSKPDQRLFQAALSVAETRPHRSVMVGDDPDRDIVPAKSLGMKGILVHEPDRRRQCEADAYIEDLLGLSELIPSLG